MRIALLSNDDGIEADGLLTLRSVADELFDEVWVVAPATQRSQVGHRVTTDEPIGCEARGERVFAIDGTPADCVRVALAHLMPVRPCWILSGINHGGNLGRHDAAISGTVAVVREGALFGIPGIAISHYLKRSLPLDWEKAASRTKRVLEELIADPPGIGEFWSVNLPHPAPGAAEPRLIRCEQELQPLQVRYEERERDRLTYVGDYHERPWVVGSDVDVCFRGDIAVTRASV